LAETHFVELICKCDDIEHCVLERYASDIRIAFDEINRLTDAIEQRDGTLEAIFS